MGHECVELRNTSAAVQCYRKAIDVSQSDYRAWYGLGQTYEMLHLYQYALYYYKKASSLRPMDARMWCAVGNCYIKLAMKSEAIDAFERASDGDDREGMAVRELARLYRDEGHMGLAAFCFFKYLLNISGRHDADMSDLQDVYAEIDKLGVSLNRPLLPPLSLGRDVLNTIELDVEKAEAMLFLAQFSKDCGEYSISTDYCSRLLDFGGQESTSAKALLREMRMLCGLVDIDASRELIFCETTGIGSPMSFVNSSMNSNENNHSRLEGKLMDDDDDD